MRKWRVSLVSVSFASVGVLLVAYVGLVAVVMSYASLAIEFSQSIKETESAVATLEARYLTTMSEISTTNVLADGYAAPIAKRYVPTESGTALR